jgi:hypothetical protein
MSGTSTVSRTPEGGKPARRPLVDDELADQLLGKAQAEGVELATGPRDRRPKRLRTEMSRPGS